MTLDDKHKQYLKKRELVFIKEVGVGQYSHYRFASWLHENEPALCEYIIEDYLKTRNRNTTLPSPI